MVYTGKPSAGCENCRKTKKACDQKLPACGRCIRLGKACGGYRDLSSLIFKNETDSVTRRVSAQSDYGQASSSTVTRQSSPDKEMRAKEFFFREFVTPMQMAYLEDAKIDDFLMKPILACALAAMANRENDSRGRELARQYYVQAINATQAALFDPKKVREDNTLFAVSLLAIFERIIWDLNSSFGSWKLHVQGSAHVLQLRGQAQLQTKTGASFFREMRHNMVVSAIHSEKEVPDYIVQWTQSLQPEALTVPDDELDLLGVRLASLRACFRHCTKSDEEIVLLAESLENDLFNWAERTQTAGSPTSYRSIRDSESSQSFNGIRHEYRSPWAYRYWNKWRSFRILLSRLQEAIWRRSWPILAKPYRPIPDSQHYRAIRSRMMNELCVAAAGILGNDALANPSQGSLSNGYLLIIPLIIAATCLLERLADPIDTPGGNRLILVDAPLHLDLFNPASVQLAWIIARLNYIADKIGMRWAAAAGTHLKGEGKNYYDLSRSVFLHGSEADEALYGHTLDMGDLIDLEGREEA